MGYVIVFLGAGLGGVLRHGTNLAAARLFGIGFPFGTLTANIVGSFLMAAIMEVFAFKSGLTQHGRLFLTTGILGGYTTFSTFTLDAMTRFQRGDWAVGSAYIVMSVSGGLLAFLVGMILIRYFLGGAT